MALLSIPKERKFEILLMDSNFNRKISIPHITTFAVLEGISVEKDNDTFFKLINGKDFMGDFYYLSEDENLEDNLDVLNVLGKDVQQGYMHGIRPCFLGESYSAVRKNFKKLNPISFFSSVYTAEFGEYVQDAVSYEMGCKLSRAYKNGELIKLNKTFSSAVGELPAYKYKNKKYVMYNVESILGSNHSHKIFPHGVEWCDGCVFLEVKPLRFVVADYFDFAICESVVQAGKPVEYDPDSMSFEESALSKYLNGTFLKDILPENSELLEHLKEEVKMQHTNTEDIAETVKNIDELSSRLDQIHELVMCLVGSLLERYNRELENLKRDVVTFDAVMLSLDPKPTKEDIKNRLLEQLERIIQALNGHFDYYSDYFKILDLVSTTHPYRAEPNVQEELGKDFNAVDAIICALDDTSMVAMKKKLGDIRSEFTKQIRKYLGGTLRIEDDELIFDKLANIKSLESLELDFRKLWQPFLRELCDIAEVSVLKKRLDEELINICEGIFENANDCMISMYLNEINILAGNIRSLVDQLPVESRAGETEKLLEILNAKPEKCDSTDVIFRFMRGKFGELYIMYEGLKSYMSEVQGIESFKYLKFGEKKKAQ